MKGETIQVIHVQTDFAGGAEVQFRVVAFNGKEYCTTEPYEVRINRPVEFDNGNPVLIPDDYEAMYHVVLKARLNNGS